MKVIGSRPGQWLVEMDPEHGRVLDLDQGVLFPQMLIGSILGRGYWTPETSVSEADLLKSMRGVRAVDGPVSMATVSEAGVPIGGDGPASEAFNPDQPREPAGSPGGGRFAGSGGAGGDAAALDKPGRATRGFGTKVNEAINAMADEGRYHEPGIRMIGLMVADEIDKRTGPYVAEVQRLSDVFGKAADDFAARTADVSRIDREIAVLHDQLGMARNGDLTHGTADQLTQRINGATDRLDQAIAAHEASKAFAESTRDRYAQMIDHQLAFITNTTIATLASVRPMGYAKGDAPPVYRPGSNQDAVKAVEQTYRFFPRDWLRVSSEESAVHPINAVTAKELIGRGIAQNDAMRGYYARGSERATVELSVGGGGDLTRIAAHEMGHRFEHVIPGIVGFEKEFYDRRTAGEAPRPLGGAYNPSEMYRPDAFSNPYMGKTYEAILKDSSGQVIDNGHQPASSYELVSMGMEGIFRNSWDVEKDPEYRHLMLGLMASVGRTHGK